YLAATIIGGSVLSIGSSSLCDTAALSRQPVRPHMEQTIKTATCQRINLAFFILFPYVVSHDRCRIAGFFSIVGRLPEPPWILGDDSRYLVCGVHRHGQEFALIRVPYNHAGVPPVAMLLSDNVPGPCFR